MVSSVLEGSSLFSLNKYVCSFVRSLLAVCAIFCYPFSHTVTVRCKALTSSSLDRCRTDWHKAEVFANRSVDLCTCPESSFVTVDVLGMYISKTLSNWFFLDSLPKPIFTSSKQGLSGPSCPLPLIWPVVTGIIDIIDLFLNLRNQS